MYWYKDAGIQGYFQHFFYICNMRKEFGKWLMDVAKYMTTALLLSSAFGDMENPWVILAVIIASAITLVTGLWLVRNKEKEKKEE